MLPKPEVRTFASLSVFVLRLNKNELLDATSAAHEQLYLGCNWWFHRYCPQHTFRREPLCPRLFSQLTVNQPHLQVVKSRIQGATKVPGVVPKYNWTYPALLTIMREEGAAALYKGFVPKVLRLAPGGGVLLLVVEFTLGVFRQGASFSCLPFRRCG